MARIKRTPVKPKKRFFRNKTYIYQNMRFKAKLRQYKTQWTPYGYTIIDSYTGKDVTGIKYNTKNEAAVAMKRLQRMMELVSVKPDEKKLIEQQGKVLYKKQMRKQDKRRYKRSNKAMTKLPPVPKFNERS